MICYQKNVRRVEPAVGKPHQPTIFRMQSRSVGHSPSWPRPVAKLQFYAFAQPPVAQLPAETTDAAIWQPADVKSARDQRPKVAVSLRRDEPCRAPLPAIWPVDFEDASAQSGLPRLFHTNTQRLISAERDGDILRAGRSSNARTVADRTFIQRRRIASRTAKVAVSLRRDEPCSAPLPAIWPVDFEDAFTQSGLHRVFYAKTQRLISAVRDGYFSLPRVARSSSARRTYRTQTMPAAKTNTLRTLSP
jgi:hypothetical protein